MPPLTDMAVALLEFTCTAHLLVSWTPPESENAEDAVGSSVNRQPPPLTEPWRATPRAFTVIDANPSNPMKMGDTLPVTIA